MVSVCDKIWYTIFNMIFNKLTIFTLNVQSPYLPTKVKSCHQILADFLTA